ncbi:MAG: phosphopantetheine adenylyltransferase [Methanomicrobiales archaeon HGW-Methanomicrobiales-4]|nr:MAG: phosphopantetheine adenylyltransferase [Methanomicrobiales archaeon HGW-Methanomicrobiales-4]
MVEHVVHFAVEIAGLQGEVTIGLTSDVFADQKSHPIHPYMDRKSDLLLFLTEKKLPEIWIIEELHDRYGSTLDADFDALIVSEETFPVAQEINRMRRANNLPCVAIHQIRCVLADDGRWISSTRIWRGEIDVHGHLIRHTRE